MTPSAADLLRDARLRGGLTQRDLASRARTAQSVVARIESGGTSPAWDTLARLLEAAGFALDATRRPLVAVGSHMLDDVPRILRLTPVPPDLQSIARQFRPNQQYLDAARQR